MKEELYVAIEPIICSIYFIFLLIEFTRLLPGVMGRESFAKINKLGEIN
jgi:hypothetical protein